MKLFLLINFLFFCKPNLLNINENNNLKSKINSRKEEVFFDDKIGKAFKSNTEFDKGYIFSECVIEFQECTITKKINSKNEMKALYLGKLPGYAFFSELLIRMENPDYDIDEFMDLAAELFSEYGEDRFGMGTFDHWPAFQTDDGVVFISNTILDSIKETLTIGNSYFLQPKIAYLHSIKKLISSFDSKGKK